MSLKQIWQAANPKGHLLTAISFLIPGDAANLLI